MDQNIETNGFYGQAKCIDLQFILEFGEMSPWVFRKALQMLTAPEAFLKYKIIFIIMAVMASVSLLMRYDKKNDSIICSEP